MNSESSEFVRVSSNPFSKIYKYHSSKNRSIYLKFFLYPKTYIIGNSDLSAVFSRDRLMASEYYEKVFRRKSIIKKYLCEESFVVHKLNLLITPSPNNCEVNLQDALLKHVETDTWMKHINTLTQDLLSTRIFSKDDNKEVNNKDILSTKMERQVKQPLLSHFSPQHVSLLINRIGKYRYVNHGDMQPKNLIYSETKIKIIDFEEGFVGPLGWDLGFLWGNALYLSVSSQTTLCKLINSWNDIIDNLKIDKLRFNFVVFTMSTILMRIYHYPIIRLSNRQKNKLLSIIEEMNNLLEV